jgi:hypothetical protein
MKKWVVVAIFTVMLVISYASFIEAETALWESYEGDVKWQANNWENVGMVEISQSSEEASEGEYSLKVDMLEEAIDWKNKVAISREDYLNLDNAKIIMDIYCPYPFGITVALAFDAGDNWAYFEAPSKPLKKGWNKDVTFDLNKSNFKCQASDWKHTEVLADKDDIRKMHILIYRPSKMEVQTVYIDNIRIE